MVDYLVNQSTIKNAIGWTFSPLITVGSPVGDLQTTPGNSDCVSRLGCKSQSYTSWGCLSRSYIGGATEVEVHTSGVQRREVTRSREPMTVDIPTKEEMRAFTPMEMNLYTKQLRVFVRGKGLLSKHQYDRLRKAQSPSLGMASGSKVPDVPPIQGKSRETRATDLKYYYSDTVPVKCFAVSSMTSPRETEPMPWSPTFQVLAGRLNDPSATGVLAAVVRGPNVRDATTWTSLVKACMIRPSTRHELAPMVRALLMNLSVSEEAYSTDGTISRFIRGTPRIDFDGLSISTKPDGGRQDLALDVVAMAVDTFVSLANNAYFANVPDGYSYTDLDVTWVAVPVSTELLGQATLIPYIASFLTTEIWAGTVNVHYRHVYEDSVTSQTWIPAANSVSIPGVRRVALVLVDETSHSVQRTVRLSCLDEHVDVPVWTGGQAAPPAPVDWHPVWDAFWCGVNVDNIRRTTTLAHQVICTRLGVSDSCGVALTLAAEVYGLWYQGIAVPHRGDTPEYDYSQPAHGCWSMTGGPIDKTGQIKAHKFTLDDENCRQARRRCVAYAFSAVSPLHLLPSGLARIRFVNDTARLRITWSKPNPDYAVPNYNIQTMTSVYRVAAFCGLMITHTDAYAFGESHGLTQWVHMLACAQSFSTAALLSANDLCPRDWAGIDNRYDLGYRQTLISGLKSSIYSGLVLHHDMEDIFNSIPEWDLDILSEYWGVDAYGNADWMTFSPVPFHALQQWMMKLDLNEKTASVPGGVTSFKYRGISYQAIKIKREHSQHKTTAACTIDVYRRCPMLLVREPDSAYKPVLHWVDNVHRYSSLFLPGYNTVLASDMYESLTFCAPVESTGIPYSDPTSWYVIGSPYMYGDTNWSGVTATPIQWPDPPTLAEMWTASKNYILKPAASALVGFLTGGPVGAAVAGGSELLGRAVKDMTAEPKEEQIIPQPRSSAMTTVTALTPNFNMANLPAKTTVGKTVMVQDTPTVMPGTSANSEPPLVMVPTVKATPTPAASPMVTKEPMKSLAMADLSPANE